MTILKDEQGNEWELLNHQLPTEDEREDIWQERFRTYYDWKEVMLVRKLPTKRVPFEEIDKFTDENSDGSFSEKTKKMARLIVKEALAQMEEKEAGPTQSTKPSE